MHHRIQQKIIHKKKKVWKNWNSYNNHSNYDSMQALQLCIWLIHILYLYLIKQIKFLHTINKMQEHLRSSLWSNTIIKHKEKNWQLSTIHYSDREKGTSFNFLVTVAMIFSDSDGNTIDHNSLESKQNSSTTSPMQFLFKTCPLMMPLSASTEYQYMFENSRWKISIASEVLGYKCACLSVSTRRWRRCSVESVNGSGIICATEWTRPKELSSFPV